MMKSELKKSCLLQTGGRSAARLAPIQSMRLNGIARAMTVSVSAYRRAARLGHDLHGLAARLERHSRERAAPNAARIDGRDVVAAVEAERRPVAEHYMPLAPRLTRIEPRNEAVGLGAGRAGKIE